MDHPNWQDITLMRLVLDYTDEQGNPQQRKMPFVYNWKAGSGTFDSVWTDEGGLLMADIIYGELPTQTFNREARRHAVPT